MSRAGVELDLPRGRVEAVYGAGPSSFGGGVAQNARVLKRLLFGRRTDLWHFFFAPNPKTSSVGRWASRLKGVPTVHTVCSAPKPGTDVRSVLFADRTVVLSAHTEAQFRAAGVPDERLVRIAPCVEPLPVPTDGECARTRKELGLPAGFLIVFPGDLEFGTGARALVEALPRLPGATLVLACRQKTAHAVEKEKELRALITERGLDWRVFWLGETPRIHSLLAAADVVALPSETLYAKMDYPLVLLEAMSLARLVVVAKGTSAEELASGDAVWSVEPTGEALAARLRDATDRGCRDETGRRARAAVLERFSPATMANAYEALYETLLGSSS